MFLFHLYVYLYICWGPHSLTYFALRGGDTCMMAPGRRHPGDDTQANHNDWLRDERRRLLFCDGVPVTARLICLQDGVSSLGCHHLAVIAPASSRQCHHPSVIALVLSPWCRHPGIITHMIMNTFFIHVILLLTYIYIIVFRLFIHSSLIVCYCAPTYFSYFVVHICLLSPWQTPPQRPS